MTDTGGQVRVWLAQVAAGQLDGDARARLSADLDEATLARLARMRREQDQDRGLAAHALLRRQLGAELGVVPGSLVLRRYCPSCGSDEHGKPWLAGFGDAPPLQFNVSHAGDLVAVAIAGPHLEVGVDVESVHRAVDWAALRRSVFADPEWEHTHASADPAHARTDLWSRKEAAVKATGHGLSTPLRSVVIGPRASGWAARIESQQPRTVIGWDLGESAAIGQLADVVRGYAAAVAVHSTVDLAGTAAPQHPVVLLGTI